MKRTTFTMIAIVSLLLIAANTNEARSKRVGQIPNGNVNGCKNCHIDPNGGGPRNVFGQLIEFNYMTAPGFSGDVIWGPELAHEDPDGDGFTNGEELQDSAGVWTGGAIGDPAQVYLPGDPNSHPPLTSVHVENKIPNNFELRQNYPNPFNPATTISFSIPKESFVRLAVFDALGRKVEELINGVMPRGTYTIDFNAENLNSGIYFYRLSTNNFTSVRRMMLMK